MKPERWQRIREFLEPALEIETEAVPAWLDANCPDDLRTEVDSLIEASHDQRTLLDQPVFRTDSVLEPGTTIGPYEIDALIGVGGMGVVYRAHDPRLDRTVAIKLLGFGGRESEMIREARAASALNHPGIVVVHDVLEYRETPAIVMEYVEGLSLADRIDDAPLPLAEAAEYAAQVADAVAAAHDAGILHRDLKPSNIIVRPDGVAKVLDFGIARRKCEAAAGEEQPAGTRGYVSPEQVAGEPLDERADIYSFGAVLRDMLSGRNGDENLPPGAWRAVLAQCLAEDQAGRYASMREVTGALDELRPGRRAPRWAAAAAVLALIAAGAAVGLAWNRPGGPPQFETTRLPSIDSARAFPHLSPDGRRVVFSASREGRQRLFVQETGALAAEPLGQEGRHAAWSPDGGRIVFRSDRDGGGLFVLTLATGVVHQLTREGFHPAWSPDGREIVYSSEGFERAEERPTSRSVLLVIDLVSGDTRALTERDRVPDAIQPTWSPDGRHVAFWSIDAGRRAVWIVPAEGGAPVQVTDGTALAWSPAFAPDGWLYWASDRAGTMNAWRARVDPDGGIEGEPRPVPLPTRYAAHFSFSAGGVMAFSAQSPISSIWRVPLEEPDEMLRLTPRSLHLQHPSVSPDGETLVAFEESPSNNLILVGTDGSDFRYLTGGDFRDRGPAWSPDGQTIAFVSNRGSDYQLWQVRPDGSGLAPFVTYDTGAFSPVWSPDGARVAWFTRGFTPMLRDLASESERPSRLPRAPAPGFRPTSWSPDGAAIAGVLRSEDGQRLGGAVLDLDTAEYDLIETPCDSVQWMPTGRTLLCVESRSLGLVSPDGRSTTPLATFPYPVDSALDISPDGRWAYVSMQESLPEIWVASPR